MKNNITELVFILDRSGSMAGLEEDTVGGFNAMIEKQKKAEGDAYISTVLFDNVSEVLHDRVKLSGIKPTVKVNQITREERRRLVDLLKEFKVTVKGFRPIDEAIITSGGVSVSEINPKTMESKKVSGLKFCGEVLDVDGDCGGYNLTFAFVSGITAARDIKRRKENL